MKDLCWHYAKEKKSDLTVVFVHHFGGNHKTTARHVKLFNSMGYNCVSFTLSCNFDEFTVKDYLRVSGMGLISKGGIVQRWSREIDFILKSVESDILIYSFSSPSLAVPFAIKNNLPSVRGWVCDGGPFFSLHKGFARYYQRIHDIQNPGVLKFFQFVANFVWRNSILEARTLNYILDLPEKFPVLSIRGKNDLLVFPEDIDKVFNPVDEHINLTRFELPKGGHLDGLARFPSEYKEALTQWLHKNLNQ